MIWSDLNYNFLVFKNSSSVIADDRWRRSIMVRIDGGDGDLAALHRLDKPCHIL